MRAHKPVHNMPGRRQGHKLYSRRPVDRRTPDRTWQRSRGAPTKRSCLSLCKLSYNSELGQLVPMPTSHALRVAVGRVQRALPSVGGFSHGIEPTPVGQDVATRNVWALHSSHRLSRQGRRALLGSIRPSACLTHPDRCPAEHTAFITKGQIRYRLPNEHPLRARK